jgi:hypothetical protein
MHARFAGGRLECTVATPLHPWGAVTVDTAVVAP